MSALLLSSHLHAMAPVPADLPCLHPLAMLLACTSPVPLSSTASSYVCSLNNGSLPLTVLTSRMLLSVRRRASFLCIKVHWHLSETVSWWESKKKQQAFTILQGWLVLSADERETATFKKAEQQVKTRKPKSKNYRQVRASKLLRMFNVYNCFCYQYSFTFWDLFSLYVIMCVYVLRGGDQRVLWGWWCSDMG